jgi:hypothetical protein
MLQCILKMSFIGNIMPVTYLGLKETIKENNIQGIQQKIVAAAAAAKRANPNDDGSDLRHLEIAQKFYAYQVSQPDAPFYQTFDTWILTDNGLGREEQLKLATENWRSCLNDNLPEFNKAGLELGLGLCYFATPHQLAAFILFALDKGITKETLISNLLLQFFCSEFLDMDRIEETYKMLDAFNHVNVDAPVLSLLKEVAGLKLDIRCGDVNLRGTVFDPETTSVQIIKKPEAIDIGVRPSIEQLATWHQFFGDSIFELKHVVESTAFEKMILQKPVLLKYLHPDQQITFFRRLASFRDSNEIDKLIELNPILILVPSWVNKYTGDVLVVVKKLVETQPSTFLYEHYAVLAQEIRQKDAIVASILETTLVQWISSTGLLEGRLEDYAFLKPEFDKAFASLATQLMEYEADDFNLFSATWEAYNTQKNNLMPFCPDLAGTSRFPMNKNEMTALYLLKQSHSIANYNIDEALNQLFNNMSSDKPTSPEERLMFKKRILLEGFVYIQDEAFLEKIVTLASSIQKELSGPTLWNQIIRGEVTFGDDQTLHAKIAERRNLPCMLLLCNNGRSTGENLLSAEAVYEMLEKSGQTVEHFLSNTDDDQNRINYVNKLLIYATFESDHALRKVLLSLTEKNQPNAEAVRQAFFLAALTGNDTMADALVSLSGNNQLSTATISEGLRFALMGNKNQDVIGVFVYFKHRLSAQDLCEILTWAVHQEKHLTKSLMIKEILATTGNNRLSTQVVSDIFIEAAKANKCDDFHLLFIRPSNNNRPSAQAIREVFALAVKTNDFCLIRDLLFFTEDQLDPEHVSNAFIATLDSHQFGTTIKLLDSHQLNDRAVNIGCDLALQKGNVKAIIALLDYVKHRLSSKTTRDILIWAASRGNTLLFTRTLLSQGNSELNPHIDTKFACEALTLLVFPQQILLDTMTPEAIAKNIALVSEILFDANQQLRSLILNVMLVKAVESGREDVIKMGTCETGYLQDLSGETVNKVLIEKMFNFTSDDAKPTASTIAQSLKIAMKNNHEEVVKILNDKYSFVEGANALKGPAAPVSGSSFHFFKEGSEGPHDTQASEHKK